MLTRGRAANPERDQRIKYNLDADKVSSAMKSAGVEDETDLKPESKYGGAKKVADELGMDGDNRNVRRGIDRFVQREDLVPENGEE